LVAGAVAGAVALAVLVACEWGRVLQWQQQREWAVWGSKAKQHKARKKQQKSQHQHPQPGLLVVCVRPILLDVLAATLNACG
jgi:hypothetical protein